MTSYHKAKYKKQLMVKRRYDPPARTKAEEEEFKRRPDEEPLVCNSCGGTGYTPAGLECLFCDGEGEVWQ